MGKRLLLQCIRLAVKEVHLARVPNQLISDEEEVGQEDSSEGNDVSEISGVGGIMGFSAPLGNKKNKRK